MAERRRAYGLTQEELAERLDVSTKYLQRLEAGDENLTIRSVVGIANALDVQPSYFLQPPRNTGPRKPGRPRKSARTAARTADKQRR